MKIPETKAPSDKTQATSSEANGVGADSDYCFQLDFQPQKSAKRSQRARHERYSLDFLEIQSDQLLDCTSMNFKNRINNPN